MRHPPRHHRPLRPLPAPQRDAGPRTTRRRSRRSWMKAASAASSRGPVCSSAGGLHASVWARPAWRSASTCSGVRQTRLGMTESVLVSSRRSASASWAFRAWRGRGGAAAPRRAAVAPAGPRTGPTASPRRDRDQHAGVLPRPGKPGALGRPGQASGAGLAAGLLRLPASARPSPARSCRLFFGAANRSARPRCRRAAWRASLSAAAWAWAWSHPTGWLPGRRTGQAPRQQRSASTLSD
jgi:hypothetical protein